MIISKLRKEITDELTTMESHFGDMDIKELSIVDRSDAVRYFNEDFEPLTDAEKASIKSLECLGWH